jgi:ribosomal protein S18 acetylase RimI-like enzyme
MSANTRVAPAVTFAEFTTMADVAARAFADNDSYTFLWHHLPADQRVAANAWLLARRFWISQHTGGAVFCAIDADSKICGTIAFAAEALQPSFFVKAQAGFFLLPLFYGWQTLTNLDQLVAAIAAHHKSAGVPTDRPVISLQMVTVDPRCQKMGIGPGLLQRALAEIKARHGRVTVLLDTQKEHAKRFYERAGFQLASEQILTPAPGHTFKNWILFKQLD